MVNIKLCCFVLSRRMAVLMVILFSHFMVFHFVHDKCLLSGRILRSFNAHLMVLYFIRHAMVIFKMAFDGEVIHPLVYKNLQTGTSLMLTPD